MFGCSSLKKRCFKALFVVAVIASSVGPASGADLDRFKDLEGSLSMAGSTTVRPIVEEAAKRIMAYNPKIKIRVSEGGSGTGVRLVGLGSVDIGNTSRRLKEKEKPGLKSYPFALDVVVVIVKADNPLDGLTSEQVRRIFVGEIANWKEVGGGDAPIELVTRPSESSTRELFQEIFLKGAQITSSAKIAPSQKYMKIGVTREKNPIGYTSMGFLDSNVKALTIDGVVPSLENAVQGSYQGMRELLMHTKGEPSGLTKAFIEYILSPEGDEIVKSNGFTPLPR